jgi:hypothetical protein
MHSLHRLALADRPRSGVAFENFRRVGIAEWTQVRPAVSVASVYDSFAAICL